MKLFVLNPEQNLNKEIEKLLSYEAQELNEFDLVDIFVKQEDKFFYACAEVMDTISGNDTWNEKITEVTKEKVLSVLEFEEKELKQEFQEKLDLIQKHKSIL